MVKRNGDPQIRVFDRYQGKDKMSTQVVDCYHLQISQLIGIPGIDTKIYCTASNGVRLAPEIEV
jgi:hypothetical protein